MGLFSTIYYFFSQYTGSDERAVGTFFDGLNEHSNQSKTRTRLARLLQHDIALINLWSEYKHKGYKYLRKSNRKKMYENLELITNDFKKFHATNNHSIDTIEKHVHHLSPHAKVDHQRIALIQSLMDYFSPSRGLYEYRDSSSFGRLLRDPSIEKLIGDCNQIVTLYIYMYSRYFDISDLQVRLLPGHVALHYNGIDIEATNGTFMSYDNLKDNPILPIEEIVSINLLDTTDSYLSKHEVAAEDFLQASRFAYILSHERNIVTNNLEAAYGSLIHTLMKRNNYTTALKFARASRRMDLIAIVGHNGAVYEMQRHNYIAARRFAEHAIKRTELIHDSYRAEGIHHFDAHHYHDAIKAFNKIGDQTLVRKSYESLFFDEQKNLGSNMTTESIKKYSGTIKRMRGYAKKSGNKQLIDHVQHLQKHL